MQDKPQEETHKIPLNREAFEALREHAIGLGATWDDASDINLISVDSEVKQKMDELLNAGFKTYSEAVLFMAQLYKSGGMN